MPGKKQGTTTKNAPRLEVNRHFIFIEAPVELVTRQVTSWGHGAWWPDDALVRFVNEGEGGLTVGSRQRVEPVSGKGPGWVFEVTKLVPQRLVERTFLDGMFSGFERIKIGERANGTRIDYEMHFRVKGFFSNVLWSLTFKKRHDLNIDVILAALKTYCEQEYANSVHGEADEG